jgi:hypothetical protein
MRVTHQLPRPPDTADLHGFVMMGTHRLFLCHLPMFYMENHCYQLICEARLAAADQATYLETRSANPGVPLILGNHHPTTLCELVTGPAFRADAFVDVPRDPTQATPFMTPTLRIARVLLFRHFDPDDGYPSRLTYFLYGTPEQAHLSHLITRAPNFQHELDLAAVPEHVSEAQLAVGVPLVLSDAPEAARQPVTDDPLTEPAYTAGVDGRAGGAIRPGTRHWFDATTLNMGGMDPVGTRYWFGDE